MEDTPGRCQTYEHLPPKMHPYLAHLLKVAYESSILMVPGTAGEVHDRLYSSNRRYDPPKSASEIQARATTDEAASLSILKG